MRASDPKADIGSILESLGFKHTWAVAGRASIADLVPQRRRCGVYILEFLNGEVYAGQAVEVARRYVQHRQTHDDIARISFKPVPRKRLNEEERNAIWRLERHGSHLRNITFTSIVYGESDLDIVVPPEEQDGWLSGLPSSDPDGPRTEDAELRRKYGRKFSRFLKETSAEQAMDILRVYIHECIPFPTRTELSFWSVSCLPAYSAPGVLIYSRVNVNWQEVFTVFRDARGMGFSWHLALSPLKDVYAGTMEGLFKEHPGIEATDHFYEPGGQDQINLVTGSFEAARSLLLDRAVIKAARLFNMRLMKKGPCIFSRFHCFDLADRLLSSTA